MAHYRAYVIGRDGRVEKAIDLTFADDEAAKKSTRQLADGCTVEVWQRDRRIAKFESSGLKKVQPVPPPI